MNAALPPLLMDLQARLRPLVARLPMEPPAFLLAAALNRLLLPRLDAAARGPLSGRAVQVDVSDLGLSLKLQLGPRGFAPASREAAIALRIVAEAPSYWRLLRGSDDADRLFFERALVMEGDTEMGLVLKNTLDAIGPLWA
ncbi:SCP2 sterol-binding domain-containing protein [Pelomonas sp. SE-A7]|uniref:ubiquinone anaerobic biosynthesis accessory factor UbiT n=1 Tax=Pelomonas sp. SE-A7 TaxID=3054953 RepID=UPI00259CE99A|nr:SCP2 sterol-binding domain-containing protein [Pelomonas sp. SE-A7]MDM4767259.1 SCP2 sterol-binding domain-containing protein [Pelomonas sp. SE-A7]